MAAATVTQRRRNGINGTQRVVSAGSIVFAASGDTWVIPGMKTIHEVNLTPTTAAAFGFTRSGNTLTLVAGTGLTFSGSVAGL